MGRTAKNIWLLTHEPFWPPSGGGSAEAAYLARALVSNGYHVTVFAPGVPGVLPDFLVQAETHGMFSFHPFSLWRMGRYARLRLFKYALYPIGLFAFIRFIEKRHALRIPDLVLCQHALCAPVAAFLRRRLKAALVINELDLLTGYLDAWPRIFVPSWLGKWLQSLELQLPIRLNVNGLLVVSDALRRRFIEQGMEASRVCTIYYGFDAELFRPLARKIDTRRVVMHGSFDFHHLGSIALEGLSLLLSSRADVTVRLIGPKTPRLSWFVSKLHCRGFGARIEHIGFVPYAEVPALLSECALGLVPYEPSEGSHCAFVAKAVECLAMGMPVVSTALEGLVSYFSGNPMIRFTSFDGRAFGKACIEWIDIAVSLRERFGRDVSRKVHEQLRWERVVERAVLFIEQLIGG